MQTKKEKYPGTLEAQVRARSSARPALTAAQASYLEMIYAEQLESGAARGCAIAKTAGVARPTVAATLRSLRDLGYIAYLPYGPIQMTPLGLEAGERLHSTRSALRRYFSIVLGIPEEAAQKIANAHKVLVTPERVAVMDCVRAFLEAHQDEWEAFRAERLQGPAS